MDLNHIQNLIDLLKKNGIKNFSVKEADGKEISLEFAYKEVALEPILKSEMATPSEPKNLTSLIGKKESAPLIKDAVKAEMVGTVYLSVSPQKPRFVDIGTKVKKGQTLCLIEAMKTYFEVKSTQDGTVDQILVEDKEAVDFGRPLFSIV